MQKQTKLNKSEEGEFMLDRYSEDAEIELIDILNVFVKHKNIIIYGTILITLIAIGISLILPKTYNISAIIEPGKRQITDENGQLVEEKYIESAASIRETILGGAYDEFIVKKFNIAENEIPKINVTVPQRTELLDISIKSRKPKLALNVLTELIARITDDLKKKMVFEINRVDSEINISEIESQTALEQVKLTEKQIYETKNTIIALEDNRRKAMTSNPNEAMAVLLYSNDIQERQIYLNDLHDKMKEYEMQSKKSLAKIENLRKKIATIKTAEVYKLPYIPAKSIGPNEWIIIVVAFILGLMVTTMTAFLLEYVETKKK